MDISQAQKAIHQVFDALKTKQVLLPAGIERQFLMDDQNGHYQLQNIGWQNSRYTHGTLVHVDIKNDFVWVQVDNTEYNIVDSLLEQGVPENRIVLGFQVPFQRQFSGFAMGNEIPV
jgi:XisI protein